MKYLQCSYSTIKPTVETIQPILDQHPDKLFIDAMCGGCNILANIVHPNRAGNDINEYVISLLTHMQEFGSSRLPAHITEQQYLECEASYVAQDNKFTKALLAWVSYTAGSGGGMFNGKFTGNNVVYRSKYRNWTQDVMRSVLRDAPRLKDISFTCLDYKELSDIYPSNSIYWFDLPNIVYQAERDNFDFEEFWVFAKYLKTQDNIVLVGCRIHPDDVEPLYQARTKPTYKPVYIDGELVCPYTVCQV